MSRLSHTLLPRLPRLRRHRRWLLISLGALISIIGIRDVILPRLLLPVRYVPPVFGNFQCPVGVAGTSHATVHPASVVLNNRPNLRCDTRVLLLIDNQYSVLGQQIRFLLNALKVPYKTHVVRRNLPSLANRNNGRYLIIIYENYYRYLNLNKWNRQLLDKYCRDYGAAVVGFLPNRRDSARQSDRAKVLGFPLYLHCSMRLQNLQIANDTQVAHLVRKGLSFKSELTDSANWVGLVPDHPTYKPVLHGYGSTSAGRVVDVSVVLLDDGELDGVRRVLIGNDFAAFWPMRMLFLDAIRYVSYNKISFPLTRYLQIDIDDIFVGHEGSKMTSDDVQELIRSQQRIRAYVSNFVYNLGFCGHFFGKGNALEREGDQALIENAMRFSWFPHHWRHAKAHAFNLSTLIAAMEMNLQFSKENFLNGSVGFHIFGPICGLTRLAIFLIWWRRCK